MAISRAETVHLQPGTTPDKRSRRDPKTKALRKVAAQRRKAEEALRQSDVPFRRYFDLGLIGMAITSPTGGIIEVNDELCRILGYGRNELLLQKSWLEMTHPEDLAADVAQFKRVLAGEIDGYSLEKRWIRKDGRVIDSIMSAKCERRPDGSVDYFVGLVLDITERKRAEEAQRKLAALVENSSDFIGLASLDAMALYVNRAGRELVGAGAEMPTNILDYIMEEDRELVAGKILPKVLSQGSWEGELRMRHFETDAAIPMHVKGFLIREEGTERALALATISRDITALKKAEEELRRSEAYLAQSERLSQTGSWALNIATGELFWSEEHFHIVGLDSAAGAPEYPLALKVFHPDDRLYVAETLERAMREKTEFETECRVVRPDGTIRFIRSLAQPVCSEAGEVTEYVGTIIDITERVRAEEELRRSEAHLAEAQRIGHIGSWIWNVRTGECLWSKEHYRMVGMDPDTFKPTMENTKGLHHTEDLPLIERTLTRAIREKSDYEMEYRIMRPDGVRYHRCIGRPVAKTNGDLQFTGVVVDLTERKQTEKALQEAQTELAHVSRMSAMGETAAAIAHEINQPLGAIVNNSNYCLQLVGKRGMEKKKRAALRDIVSDANRASDIITRVRALTKRSSPGLTELNLRELIDEALTLAKHPLNEHGISVNTRLAEDALTVHADRVQLQQVLLNLIVNAIDAMTDVTKNQRILTISARLGKLDRKAAVLISIADKGIGFTRKTADRMFDAFYTTKPDGTGMGLRISRSIIESSGGQLSARRNKGRGATFSFILPV